jgi:hypothetical protein
MTVFQPARLGALIAVIGLTSSLAPSCCSAGFAAVALTMVAMAADEKERDTAGATTKAWSDRSFRRKSLAVNADSCSWPLLEF